MSTTTESTSNEPAKYNMRTFRSSADIENFYRFIYDNDLRGEAKQILELVVKAMKPKKKKSRRGRKKKIQ